MMAMVRLNVPSVFIYGGSILPGKYKGKDVTVIDVFEAVGKHAAGTISDQDLKDIEQVAPLCWIVWRSVYSKYNGMYF
jgi:dihydroxy-acid dehydratase